MPFNYQISVWSLKLIFGWKNCQKATSVASRLNIGFARACFAMRTAYLGTMLMNRWRSSRPLCLSVCRRAAVTLLCREEGAAAVSSPMTHRPAVMKWAVAARRGLMRPLEPSPPALLAPWRRGQSRRAHSVPQWPAAEGPSSPLRPLALYPRRPPRPSASRASRLIRRAWLGATDCGSLGDRSDAQSSVVAAKTLIGRGELVAKLDISQGSSPGSVNVMTSV